MERCGFCCGDRSGKFIAHCTTETSLASSRLCECEALRRSGHPSFCSPANWDIDLDLEETLTLVPPLNAFSSNSLISSPNAEWITLLIILGLGSSIRPPITISCKQPYYSFHLSLGTCVWIFYESKTRMNMILIYQTC